MKKAIEKYNLVIIVILTILTFTGFTTTYVAHSTNNKTKLELESFSYIDKIKHLQKTYKAYKETSSVEMHMRWLALFDNAIYKRGGNSNFNQYDCLSSSWSFWRSYKANVKLEDIPSIKKRLDYTKSRIYKIKKVSSGDIIIFKPVWSKRVKGKKRRAIWHIGVVEKVVRNQVFYMDVSVGTRTRGFKTVYFYNKRVAGVYEVNFPFWIGDLYKEVRI